MLNAHYWVIRSRHEPLESIRCAPKALNRYAIFVVRRGFP